MKQSLTEKEFKILVAMAEFGAKMSQREIQEAASLSLGSVNRALKSLAEKKFAFGGEIRDEGLAELQKFRAKRAIFLAAGFSAPLVPITLNTPKPLIRVNGTRLIDTALDALLQAGIDDITVVRGYLAEQFDALLYKYPKIKFLENPAYSEENNIASILRAKSLLQNAYVLESDLLVRNPAVVEKYAFRSNFLCSFKARTEGWCFEAEGGEISDEKIGGERCWQMKGISYWSAEDGGRLAAHLQAAYDSPGGKSLFWEQVPLKKFRGEYRVAVRECADGDIAEINTFSELKAADKSYSVGC